jgi:hypothetical protein
VKALLFNNSDSAEYVISTELKSLKVGRMPSSQVRTGLSPSVALLSRRLYPQLQADHTSPDNNSEDFQLVKVATYIYIY